MIKPCKICGSTRIELWECGYSAFNPGGGRCSECRQEVSGDAGCNPSQGDLAAIWNAGQDPSEVETLRAEIKRLKDEVAHTQSRLEAVRERATIRHQVIDQLRGELKDLQKKVHRAATLIHHKDEYDAGMELLFEAIGVEIVRVDLVPTTIAEIVERHAHEKSLTHETPKP
jgi:hypothetical protein